MSYITKIVMKLYKNIQTRANWEWRCGYTEGVMCVNEKGGKNTLKLFSSQLCSERLSPDTSDLVVSYCLNELHMPQDI